MSLSVAEQMRETLAALSQQSALLEQLIGLDGANVYGDFQTTLAVASQAGLRRLETALRDHRVTKGAYCVGGRVGCLVFHLFGVTKNDELINLDVPSVETGFTIYRTIQAWDHGRLSREVVEHFLQQELASRESQPEPCLANRKDRESA